MINRIKLASLALTLALTAVLSPHSCGSDKLRDESLYFLHRNGVLGKELSLTLFQSKTAMEKTTMENWASEARVYEAVKGRFATGSDLDMDVISRIKSAKTICLCNAELSDSQVLQLAKIIEMAKENLKELDLTNCVQGAGQAKILAPALERTKRLNLFCLSTNNLGYEGIVLFLSAIKVQDLNLIIRDIGGANSHEQENELSEEQERKVVKELKRLKLKGLSFDTTWTGYKLKVKIKEALRDVQQLIIPTYELKQQD